MSGNATATLTLHIAGSPTVSASWQLEAEVVDRAIVKIPKKTAKYDVPLQPGPGDKILLLLITAPTAKYPTAVTYKLGSGNADLKLSAPQIVSGSDLINEISKKPSTITFKNPGPDDVTVDLIVIRKA